MPDNTQEQDRAVIAYVLKEGVEPKEKYDKEDFEFVYVVPEGQEQPQTTITFITK